LAAAAFFLAAGGAHAPEGKDWEGEPAAEPALVQHRTAAKRLLARTSVRFISAGLLHAGRALKLTALSPRR
jgi:hypothetical protein